MLAYFCIVFISTSGVGELALLVKSEESTKLRQPGTIQVYVPLFWWCFLVFITVDRAENSDMNRQQHSSRLPGSYEEILIGKATPALASFHEGLLSWSNRKF